MYLSPESQLPHISKQTQTLTHETESVKESPELCYFVI